MTAMRTAALLTLALLSGIFSGGSLAASAPPEFLEPVGEFGFPADVIRPRDVTWSGDQILAVTLSGVHRFSNEGEHLGVFVPEGALPDGSPYPELIDADDNSVVIIGGGRRNYLTTDLTGEATSATAGGPLYPRGLAVTEGVAYYLGWMGGRPAGDQVSGALWRLPVGEPLEAMTPLHHIDGEKALAQWRINGFPYAGSVVAEPGGTIALMTTVEPALYRFSKEGELLETLPQDSDLLIDHRGLAKNYAQDVTGRYTQFFASQPLLDDLVVTPWGTAALVRQMKKDRTRWTLRLLEGSAAGKEIELAIEARGPFPHMRCESRDKRLACLTSLPGEEEALVLSEWGNAPTLILFEFP